MNSLQCTSDSHKEVDVDSLIEKSRTAFRTNHLLVCGCCYVTTKQLFKRVHLRKPGL